MSQQGSFHYLSSRSMCSHTRRGIPTPEPRMRRNTIGSIQIRWVKSLRRSNEPDRARSLLSSLSWRCRASVFSACANASPSRVAPAGTRAGHVRLDPCSVHVDRVNGGAGDARGGPRWGPPPSTVRRAATTPTRRSIRCYVSSVCYV